MGYSTNMTTSEDQFECLNETEPGTSVLPILFISLYFTLFKAFVLMTKHFYICLIFLFINIQVSIIKKLKTTFGF